MKEEGAMEDTQKILQKIEELKVELVINRAKIRGLRRRVNRIDVQLAKLKEMVTKAGTDTE